MNDFGNLHIIKKYQVFSNGCKTNMNIQNLLYENEDAIQILQSALIGEDFFDTIRAGITIHGGFTPFNN
jgi:hypothetical protein